MTETKKFRDLLEKWNLRRIAGAPRRFSRRRGFGIHSPFAYRFVREVIGQRCAYYSYSQIKEMAAHSKTSRRNLQLLFRIALHIQPESIGIDSEDSSIIVKAIKLAVPNATLSESPDLYITDDCGLIESASACFNRGGTVVVLNSSGNRSLTYRIWSSSDCGMLFRGSNTAILIGRKGLPHQIFNVWI